MNKYSLNSAQNGEAGIDLFRLCRSKEIVDLCPNTLRAFHQQGLRFYRCGGAVFISKSELEQFIRSRADAPISKKL